ncbi:30S ribosomal protein S13 [Candidatus Woesearchaeota archaeon]|jgi:small subunit ribosomal protein S13|nr:30S ribosomal protein S13 [Candidatus Woesearchaeota archaeon]
MADNEFREIIRLGDKDIRGNVPMGHALTKPKGSSYMFANAVCKVLNLDIKRKCGDYTVKEVEKIEDVIRNPAKYNIPTWLMNRRRDRETGEDKHILSSDLDLTKQFDIRFMRKVKSYKGVRHAVGAKKVRGQSTKSTGRTGTVATRRKETK